MTLPPSDEPATDETTPVADRGRSPAVATVLSAIWPGLGQWYLRHRRAALLQAIPPVLAIAAVAIFLLGQRREQVVVTLFQPGVSLTILAVVIGLGIWRLVSMGHARWLGDRRASGGQRRMGWAALAVAALLVVGVHAYAGSFPWSFYTSGQAIFQPDPSAPIGIAPTPSPSSPPPTLAPGATASPVPPPTATPEPTPPAGARINLLFIGIDASPDRREEHRLSDTILIASFDAAEGRVEMVSLPRDIARFPLFDRPDTEFDGKINELMAYADEHPERYPQGGIATLIAQVEYLVGVDIDYYASAEIPGFRDMIDAVGGVDIVNERLIDDPEFEWNDGRVGYRLEPGPHHLDGVNALSYVRSRKGVGNTDFQRARRQQEVLLALRQKLDDPDVLARLPDILGVAARTVRTNVPTSELPALMDLARRSGDAKIKSVVLGPTTYASLIPASEIGGLYALKLDLDTVADLSVRVWGPESRFWDPSAPVPSEPPGASPTGSPGGSPGAEPAETELPAAP